MENERIEQIRVKLEEMSKSKNTSKDELLRISRELDALINEWYENNLAV
ncbi:MAG: aspartyl-phosphate phosphatase Spo0E family protein [Vallitaleaceae bacterium]|nr:aspartyl-phosphate phosphatase Spo0E family protein [Vallitaleaceae bacterium]